MTAMLPKQMRLPPEKRKRPTLRYVQELERLVMLLRAENERLRRE